ncbi:hypothetical protein SDC9_165870 [bioreactor metagenome]|uniref:Uncharacterized protein n=1 Tax=bioreactor metagenome TaxID=1076179 RepID=A0A645FXZ1_9ZZZZ
MHGVIHGVALRQKLRIARDAHRHIPLKIILDELLHLVVCADRYGRLDHDEAIPRDTGCNLSANCGDVAKVCAAVGLLRRTNADEDRVRVGIRALVITRKKQSACGKVFLEQFLKPGFIDGRNSLAHTRNFLFVHIDAGDGVPFFCKANAGYQTDIARSRNG